MSQTDAPKPLGVIAAAAATAAPPAEGDDESSSDKKGRTGRKIFIVVGQVHEFDSASKAEKFLNGEDAPETYTVIRGNEVGISQKVSLR